MLSSGSGRPSGAGGSRRVVTNVLVTGAAGYLGSQLLPALAANERIGVIVATDIRVPAAPSGRVVWRRHDVRDDGLGRRLAEQRVDTVIHLASIVTPGPASHRAFEYAVDVGGTERVLEAAVTAGVRRIVVTSSGAAYGYHADNPVPLREVRYRRGHPALEQVVFRVGTILGRATDNQITALFLRRRPLVIRGASSPFGFVWDQDVVRCLERAVADGPAGIYNVAGDGTLSMEQVDFLRYRPVLATDRLQQVFGFVPSLTSAATFELWRSAHSATALP